MRCTIYIECIYITYKITAPALSFLKATTTTAAAATTIPNDVLICNSNFFFFSPFHLMNIGGILLTTSLASCGRRKLASDMVSISDAELKKKTGQVGGGGCFGI